MNIDGKIIISFEFEGDEIINPYRSHCGRFDVDPRTYGFYAYKATPGIESLRKDLPDGTHLLLFDYHYGPLPKNDREKPVVIGHYTESGEALDWHVVPSDDQMEAIAAGGEEAARAIMWIRRIDSKAERIHTALVKAQEAFWHAFASDFPEAKSGDFAPEEQLAFDEACARAAMSWLGSNMKEEDHD